MRGVGLIVAARCQPIAPTRKPRMAVTKELCGNNFRIQITLLEGNAVAEFDGNPTRKFEVALFLVS
jgi:hypothetical protein